MVTVIAKISCRRQFENLKLSLPKLEKDWNLGIDFLCVVDNQNLYLEVKDWLIPRIDRGECLVVYNEKQFSGLGEYLTNKNDFIFLTNLDCILCEGAITELYGDFIEKPTAGFVSGFASKETAICRLEDLYESGKIVFEDFPEEKLAETDTSSLYGMLVKKQIYLDFSWALADSEYSFGIELRKKGYKNYIDTSIKYKESIE